MKKHIAAIYCRVSTVQQNRPDFSSLDTQEERCKQWVKDQGYDTFRVYRDVESGGTLQRPKLQELLLDAQGGRFDLIVVTKIDRFCRSMPDYFEMIGELDKSRVGIYAIDQPTFSTAGPSGKLMRNVLLAAAEFERDMIRQRTEEGMRAKIARGEWHGTPLPYGYDNVEKKLVVNEVEAELIRRIFRDYLNGVSSKDIAEQLNQEGYRTKKGNPFTIQSILRMLGNTVYIGKLSLKEGDQRALVPGQHTPVIDEEAFAKAQRIREAHQVNAYLNKALPSEALFASLLRCGHCGSLMTTSFTYRRGIKFTYYRCLNALKRGRKACPIGQISSVDIEAIGVSLLRMLARDEKLLEAVVAQAVSQDRTAEDDLKKQRKDLIGRCAEEKKRADGLLVALEKGNATDVRMLVDRLRERQEATKMLDDQIAALDKQIAALPPSEVNVDDLRDRYLYFWQVWREMPFAQRVRAIRTIVRELRLYATEPGQFRLEIDLVSKGKTNPSTSGGGGGEIVRNSVAYGSA